MNEENGKRILAELHYIRNECNSNKPIPYGKDVRKIRKYVQSLSNEDFEDFMYMPIGNIARIHYTAVRKRKKYGRI